jgi:hypothetical protein
MAISLVTGGFTDPKAGEMQCARAPIDSLSHVRGPPAEDPFAAGPAGCRPLGNLCCNGRIYYNIRCVKLI